MNQIPLVILQHPDEVAHAKNTGRLLHLCLQNSQLLIGEKFSTEVLSAHKIELEKSTAEYFDCLLYPATTDYTSIGIQAPPKFDWQNVKTDAFLNNSKLRLWVIDASWRKSRKMLYLNSFLQSMPLVHLDETPETGYFIRKAHSENQLSTLEASCYALQQLENHTVDYNPVFSAFKEFVATQAKFFKFSDD